MRRFIGNISTNTGHFLRFTNNGGVGGPSKGKDAQPLHSDARVANGWEHFRVVPIKGSQVGPQMSFSLMTAAATYLTANHMGGMPSPPRKKFYHKHGCTDRE
jgi:hypothetical protein